MTLYPIVGDGGTSQLILKRLYHSSETRRFLGAKRGTEKQRGREKTDYMYASKVLTNIKEQISI